MKKTTKKTTKAVKVQTIDTQEATALLAEATENLRRVTQICDGIKLEKTSKIVEAAIERLSKIDAVAEATKVQAKIDRESTKAERTEAAEAKKAERAKKLIAQLAKLGVQVK